VHPVSGESLCLIAPLDAQWRKLLNAFQWDAAFLHGERRESSGGDAAPVE
jgi:hypothetical protein